MIFIGFILLKSIVIYVQFLFSVVSFNNISLSDSSSSGCQGAIFKFVFNMLIHFKLSNCSLIPNTFDKYDQSSSVLINKFFFNTGFKSYLSLISKYFKTVHTKRILSFLCHFVLCSSFVLLIWRKIQNMLIFTSKTLESSSFKCFYKEENSFQKPLKFS